VGLIGSATSPITWNRSRNSTMCSRAREDDGVVGGGRGDEDAVARCFEQDQALSGASFSLNGESWLDWPMRETTSTRS
jgi:hypothetical protein